MENTKSVVVSAIIKNVDDQFIRNLLGLIPVDIVFDAIVSMSSMEQRMVVSDSFSTAVTKYNVAQFDTFSAFINVYKDFSGRKGQVEYLWGKLVKIAAKTERIQPGMSNKVLAIKEIRQETGLGLKPAMDLINDCVNAFDWDFL